MSCRRKNASKRDELTKSSIDPNGSVINNEIEIVTPSTEKNKELLFTKAMKETPVTTPDEAIQRLKEGNKRFVNGSPIYPNYSIDRVKETTTGQSPFATVVGCGDSRVPVEIVFDRGIADIFVVRIAGNTIHGDTVLGSVDYSIGIGSKVIVILGHDSCGGITGAITHTHHENHNEEEVEDPSHPGKVNTLLEILQEDVKEYIGKPEMLNEAIRANAMAQVKHLLGYPHVKKLVDEGKLKVVPAHYSLTTGEVEFY